MIVSYTSGNVIFCLLLCVCWKWGRRLSRGSKQTSPRLHYGSRLLRFTGEMVPVLKRCLSLVANMQVGGFACLNSHVCRQYDNTAEKYLTATMHRWTGKADFGSAFVSQDWALASKRLAAPAFGLCDLRACHPGSPLVTVPWAELQKLRPSSEGLLAF